jgi:hypothetical protein
MKTNRNARRIARRIANLRPLLTLLVLLGIVGLEVWLGASTAARLGQTTGLQTSGTQAPDVSLGALIDAI